jgi:hypothetical protein
LYPSAQTRNGKNNVVLFYESSLVEKLTTSDDNAIFVETEIQTADGPEPEYWVFQRTAPKEEATGVTAPFAAETSQKGSLGDGRIATLRIDLLSVEVHHIESVVYKHLDYQVHRGQD